MAQRWRCIQWLMLVVALTMGELALAAQEETGKLPVPTQGSLLYRSPISGAYESVPLLHTDVEIDVKGLVASTTVNQQYANSSTTPIEAVYIFPLPHDAAIYDIEIHVGQRVIRGVIKEREEAKRTYETAKSEGKRAALLDEERPNVFTISVANIMPGDKVEVQLRYVEPLRWDDGKIRLVFPMVVGPRYIPGASATGHRGTGWSMDTDQVPDASRITPVVRNPESRSGHDIAISVDIDEGFHDSSLKCISHAVRAEKLKDGRQHVELAAGATIPNRDFVLEVKQGESKQANVALFLSPAHAGETDFLLAAYPPTVQPITRMPVEMLYMIDTSGSMEGTSIVQAREALLNAMDRLTPSDRFAILEFNSVFREFNPQPLETTTENLESARRFVRNLRAGGGTEMLPALLHLMNKQPTSGYLRHIVLLTDGDLGNEEEIFAGLRKGLGDARLYTVAIGSAPNLFLATKMAEFGRGTFTHIADNSETREKMSQLLDTIQSPVLTDVKLTFSGVEVKDVYPKNLPDLFLRQPLIVYGHITKGQSGRLHLTARAGDVPYEVTIPFDASKASFHPGITTLWARQRLEDLMDDWRHADEGGQKEIRSTILAHALEYRLVTKFTSLVAVEEVPVNAGGQSNTVPVATELPSGWSSEAVFGTPATGTADDFLEALAIALLVIGAALAYFDYTARKVRAA